MSIKEVVRYYSDISEKYDKLRLGSEKGKLISNLQLDWFIRNLKDDGISLEVGCGTGRVTQLLVKNVKFLVAVDASLAMLKINRDKLKNASICYVVCDATFLPFRENAFSNIIGARIFWHIPNFLNALREAFRTLKTKGNMLFDFPSLRGPFSLYTKLRHIKHDVLTLFASKSDINRAFKSMHNITFFYNTTVFLFFIPIKLLKYKLINRFILLFETLNYKFFNDYVFTYYLIKVVKES